MMENLKTMRYAVEENTTGQMANFMRVNGLRIRCTGMEPLCGLTSGNMRANFQRIREKVQGQ